MAEDTPAPQRAWRAMCPQCGAPVEFRSAAAPLAVCSYCRSTLVREGEALRRIGQVGELFDDHSPLQLGASGRHQGAAFTLVGRLQWRSAQGTWNEWHALFDTGPNAQRSGWLSEDNGQYVFGFDAPAPPDLPQATGLHAGAEPRAGGQAWSVAAVSTARVASAEGELPGLPDLAQDHQIVELRNPQGEVASWALAGGAEAARIWSIGRAVRLDELALQGLKEESTRQLKGRSLSCPSCGASISPTLESTQTLVCGQCKAVIDISQENAGPLPSFLAPPRGAGGAQPGPGGAQRPGGELNHYAQAQGGATGAMPLIPLGSTGRLALGSPQPLPWQVVGYMERCELPEDPHDDTVFWREYLLYHRTEGFAFLVDSEDGWSWVRPISGAPKSLGGERVAWDGTTYRKKYSYAAKTTWVLGEFYWPVRRDQRSHNTDYEGTGAQAARQLNREQAGDEVTWSAGATLEASAVRLAFRLPESAAAVLKRDAGATSGSRFTLSTFFVLLFVVALVFTISRCSRDDCASVRQTFGAGSLEAQQCERSNGYRGGGGSFGGFSSGGGGHK